MTLERRVQNQFKYLTSFHRSRGILSGKRKEGYQVVAVDRAPTGMDLAECVLPRRCVFVLRGEDDLPMAILQQCDECVEVCRLGRVTHLEVHVNCALVLHEYVRQHFC